MSKILELREKRAKAWDAAKAFLDSKRGTDGLLSAEDAAAYDKMEVDIVNLGKEIARLERQEALDAELGKPVNSPITEKPAVSGKQKTGRSGDEYRSAFWNVMRSKAPHFEVVNALQIGTDSEGGYLVPDEFERTLVDGLQEENIFRQFAHIIQTSSGDRKIPVVATKGTASWIDEEGAYPESDDSFGQVSIGAYKLGTMAGLEFDEDTSGVATRILPTALTADNQILLLPEKYVDSPHISEYPFPIVSMMDTGYQIDKEVDGAVPYPTVDSCYTAMRQFASDKFLAGADIPKLSLSVDFVDWKDITGYEKYKSLLTVGLGDDVTVDYMPFGVSVKLRVCAVSYNCLTDRYETLTIGEKRISVVNSINSDSQKINEVKQAITVTNQNVSSVTKNVEDINSDDKLTPIEKSAALRDWSSFANEKGTLNTQAAALGITAELSSYNDAFQLLSNYLNGGALFTTGIPLWLDAEHLNITTDISGAQFREKFSDYDSARNTLVQAITAKLKALADTAQNGVDTNAGEITTINSTLTTVQTDVNGLKTSVSSIDNQISNTEDGITLRLSNAESTIEQHSSSIVTKVESSTFDAYVSDNGSKLEDVNTQITTMRQTVDGLTLSVSQTGYRNLLKNSAGKNGLTFWNTTGTVTTVSNTDTSNNTMSNSTFSMASGSTISQNFSLKFNVPHTVSLLYKASGSGGHVSVSMTQNSTETILYDNTNTGTDWTFVTFPFNSLNTVCTVKVTTSVNVLASDLIISEGTNVAPWVQSDEELYTTNFIADSTGLTVGSNITDMKAHISTSAFEIYRGDDLRINVAPDGTRLQKTIIEDDLTVGSVKEIVRSGVGVDFVVI